jgi:hypothetical protein
VLSLELDMAFRCDGVWGLGFWGFTVSGFRVLGFILLIVSLSRC